MGILLVYDVTDEASFNNIRNWMRNIEQHASDNVNKVIPTGHACCKERAPGSGQKMASSPFKVALEGGSICC